MIKILYVCLGNICRSTMAEGTMIKLIKDNNLENKIAVESAGTASYHVGELADYRTRNVLSKNGIDLTTKARRICLNDFYEFDYIFAMDQNNLADILLIKPDDSKANIKLFRSVIPDEKNQSVPDPYYGTIDDFKKVYTICANTNSILLKSLFDIEK